MTPRSKTFNAHKLQSMVAGRPHEGPPPAGPGNLKLRGGKPTGSPAGPPAGRGLVSRGLRSGCRRRGSGEGTSHKKAEAKGILASGA